MKILKLGGSVITNKKGYKAANIEQIKNMAKLLADVWKNGERQLVIVHGAGSFGHAVVLKHKINEGINNEKQKVAYSDTHAACSELSLLLIEMLIEAGVPAVSIPPSALIKQKNKRITEFNDSIINDYLKAGYLPVLYGDMVLDEELGGSVCSGDQIMAWFGNKKGTEVLIFATDVDGVLDDNDNVIKQINKQNFEEISKHLKERDNDVTGAMKGKVKELLDVDAWSYIVNANKPERIKALLERKDTLSTAIVSKVGKPKN